MDVQPVPSKMCSGDSVLQVHKERKTETTEISIFFCVGTFGANSEFRSQADWLVHLSLPHHMTEF